MGSAERLTASDLAARLDAKQTGPHEWRAKCPAHDDHTPSLTITEGADGRTLLKCFGGCTFEHITRALGIEPASLMGDSERPTDRNGSKPTRTLTRTYDYVDEAGALLYQVCRYEPKDFRQRRPDGSGGWIWKLDGVRRVLYRLPDVIAAVAAGRPIWIPEGERDADALGRIGCCATTNAGGAGNWTSSLNEPLRGAHVVILPDHDDRGRQHADNVARQLHGIAKTVRILALPDLPPKGDVSDWLRGKQPDVARSELLKLSRDTPLFDPEAAPPVPRPKKREAAETRSAEELEPMEPVDTWPEPLPLDATPDPPAFPIDALPATICAFVEAVAEHTQTPSDLPALLALGALSTACARTARIQGSPGWTEALNLYACVALPSGSRKSAVVQACARPIEEYEAAECERRRPEISAKTAERATLEHRLQALTRKAANCPPDLRMAADAERNEAAREFAEKPDEHMPRSLADDATPEVLARLMAEQQGRIACLSAEGAVVFEQAAGRYSESGPKLEVYLAGHAGDTLRVDRVGRKTDHVRAPALTLCLTVQPSALTGAMARPDFKGRGLLARFLWAVPRSQIGYRKLNTGPVPARARDEYARLLRCLLQRHPCDDPPVIHMSPDAAVAFLAFRERCEHELRPGERFEHLQDWGSKLPGLALRIAGLLHLVEHADDVPVCVETIEAACRIGEYAAGHALIAFGMMGADPIRAKAERLLQWIRRKSLDETTSGQAYRENRAHFDRPSDAMPALDMLAEFGHLREVPDRGATGRPTRRFDVNPKTHARNTHNTRDPVEEPTIVHSVHCVQGDAPHDAAPACPDYEEF